MRFKRTNGTTTYQYVYNGSSLSQMTFSGNTLSFAYDASGAPMAMTYNDTTYYYVTNVQGDVTAILDSTGTAVVQYTYDAWGNILSTTGDLATTLGTHNPLRYRGYVYDSETGLYYCQSRYYSPKMGRFINADAFTSTGQGLLGNNMFTYCLNNPVSCKDNYGTYTVKLEASPDGLSLEGEQKFYFEDGTVSVVIRIDYEAFGGFTGMVMNAEVNVKSDSIEITLPNDYTISFSYDPSTMEFDSLSVPLDIQGYSAEFIDDGLGMVYERNHGQYTVTCEVFYELNFFGLIKQITGNALNNISAPPAGGWPISMSANNTSYAGLTAGGNSFTNTTLFLN